MLSYLYITTLFAGDSGNLLSIDRVTAHAGLPTGTRGEGGRWGGNSGQIKTAAMHSSPRHCGSVGQLDDLVSNWE